VTSGALPAGLSLSSGGVISGTPTSAGTTTPTIRVTDSAAATASAPFSLTVSCVPLSVLSTSPLPTGSQGVSYSSQLSSSGGNGAKSWSVIAGALPGGITLSAAGLLSGTPSVSGTFSATIQVQDSCVPTPQTASKIFSVTINSLPAIVTTSPLPGANEGQPYSVQLAATGGLPPYAWSITGGALPVGLTLSSTGIISGTPTQVGNSVALAWNASTTSGVTYNNKSS
jgi:hypothetical protein